MKDSRRRKIIYSSVLATVTLATVVGAAVEAIVGFIAVYFFAPLWSKVMKKFKKEKDEQDTSRTN